MLVSRFYGQPLRYTNHKPWRLATLPKERVRGAIRGAANRERLLHPSPARAIQRRIRYRLIAAYRRRFGFPFVLCAREHTRASILASLAERLDHARDEEIRIALGEVAKICRLRLLDLVAADDGATVSQA